MPNEDESRNITLDQVGTFVLHGADAGKHAILLDALAAAPKEEIVGLLMGAAYGAEETEAGLAEVADSLGSPDAEDKVSYLVVQPWPADTELRFNIPLYDEDSEDNIQVVTLDLEDGNETLGAAMAVTENAAQQAPSLT